MMIAKPGDEEASGLLMKLARLTRVIHGIIRFRRPERRVLEKL